MFKLRLNKLQEELIKNKLDGVILTNDINRFYISGFYGSFGYAIITQNDAFLINDSRYIEQATQQAKYFQTVMLKGNAFETINLILNKHQIKTLGFEDKDLAFYKYRQFKEKLNIVSLIPIGDLFEDFRKIKDKTEINKIKKAAEISDMAFSHILNIIKPGITEIDIAIELEFFMKKHGAKALSFDTIVASGIRASLPHGQPTNKEIEWGDIITLDFGCIFEEYCSDITRTIAVGSISPKHRKVYNIVLEAQLKALEAIKAGRVAKDIDKVARDIISLYGYADNFGHGLGHGVGCEIHESPKISPLGEDILKPGMVITIEPGIYIEGFGGVRIEDMVVVTDNSIENFTSSTKEL